MEVDLGAQTPGRNGEGGSAGLTCKLWQVGSLCMGSGTVLSKVRGMLESRRMAAGCIRQLFDRFVVCVCGGGGGRGCVSRAGGDVGGLVPIYMPNMVYLRVRAGGGRGCQGACVVYGS